MKYLLSTCIVLFVGMQIQAQVGINTSDPHATLDVNGTLRVQTRSMSNMMAHKLLAVDEYGMMVEVDMDENLYLKDNVLRYSNRHQDIYNYPAIMTIPVINDLAGIIWPGATGNGRSLVRMNPLLVDDIEVTGLSISNFSSPADADGYTVRMYNVRGEIKFKDEDNGSNPENQLLLSNGNDYILKQYEIITLMYDGNLERWLVLSRH